VLALAFHVDYWNYTGRVDPFANPMFSNRQRKYSERFGLVYLASPYFVVDGRWQSEGSNSLPIRDFLNSKKEITLSEPDIELAEVREDLIRIYRSISHSEKCRRICRPLRPTSKHDYEIGRYRRAIGGKLQCCALSRIGCGLRW
jgi:hypothetical protein